MKGRQLPLQLAASQHKIPRRSRAALAASTGGYQWCIYCMADGASEPFRSPALATFIEPAEQFSCAGQRQCNGTGFC